MFLATAAVLEQNLHQSQMVNVTLSEKQFWSPSHQYHLIFEAWGLCMFVFVFVCAGSICLQLHMLYDAEDATVCWAAKEAFHSHHFAVLFVWLRLRKYVPRYLEGALCWVIYAFLFWSPDLNECVTNTHTCQPNERCVNTVGAFMCERQISCSSGYQLRNGVCEGWYSLLLLFLFTPSLFFWHSLLFHSLCSFILLKTEEWTQSR